MDPITIISAAVETLKVLKELKGVSDKVRDAKYENLIADLTLALADLKRELAALKSDNHGLMIELRKLKEKPVLVDSFERREGVLFPKEVIAGQNAGPYCSRCLEVDGRLVSVTRLFGPLRRLGIHQCPQCEKFFS